VGGWIAPGGPKARDRNPFVCFCYGGYFGRAFAADELAHREDPRQQLIRREHNGKGFYGVVQMVNHLAQRGVAIATPDLRQRLEQLKRGAGRLRAPAPRHIDRLPGEVEADAGVIEVGSFHSHGDGSATKTGHRFALPLPLEWVSRYRLDDREHSRRMLTELRQRHAIRTAERPDGTVQFFNNGDLPVKLFGYHQPRTLPGKPKPKARRPPGPRR